MPINPRRTAGFTLIEMLVVLVILGLVGSLVISRGPARSAGLDLRLQAGAIAQALRSARGQAIATDRIVAFNLDLARRRFNVGTGLPHALPAPMQLAATETVIRFGPDGSASGGFITLAEGNARIGIGVDWLTGRISIEDAR